MTAAAFCVFAILKSKERAGIKLGSFSWQGRMLCPGLIHFIMMAFSLTLLNGIPFICVLNPFSELKLIKSRDDPEKNMDSEMVKSDKPCGSNWITVIFLLRSQLKAAAP